MMSDTMMDDPMLPISTGTASGRHPLDIATRYLRNAPVNLEAMAKDLGILVSFDPSLEADITGKITACQEANASFRIAINPTHKPGRQRFTLAHEIAHYLLHRDLIGEGIVDDVTYSSTLVPRLEQQANRMATQFLMPRAVVQGVFRAGLTDVTSLSQAFLVPHTAMRLRLEELGLAA